MPVPSQESSAPSHPSSVLSPFATPSNPITYASSSYPQPVLPKHAAAATAAAPEDEQKAAVTSAAPPDYAAYHREQYQQLQQAMQADASLTPPHPPLHPSLAASAVSVTTHLFPSARFSSSMGVLPLSASMALSSAPVLPVPGAPFTHPEGGAMTSSSLPSSSSTAAASTSALLSASSHLPVTSGAAMASSTSSATSTQPNFSMSTFTLNPTLSVTCFRRGGPEGAKLGPLFVVREFDAKVIRSSPKLARGQHAHHHMAHAAAVAAAAAASQAASSSSASGQAGGVAVSFPLPPPPPPEPSPTSEQAFRASIRQAMLNMNLRPESATKSEIRVLKAQGILGKRAPSCSLLSASDMCRLLIAFGKEQCAEELREATQGWNGREHVVGLGIGIGMRPTEGVSVMGTAGPSIYGPTIPAKVAMLHSKTRFTFTNPEAFKPRIEDAHHIAPADDTSDHAMSGVDDAARGDVKQRKDGSISRKERKHNDKADKGKQGGEKENERKKRKRKAEASPMLSSSGPSGLDALLFAVNGAAAASSLSTNNSPVASSSSPYASIVRAQSTPPFAFGQQSALLMMPPPSTSASSVSATTGLQSQQLQQPSSVLFPFLQPGASAHVFPSTAAVPSAAASPLYAPVPIRSQTPSFPFAGAATALSATSQSPSPSTISPSSTHSTSAFSSPASAPRPLLPRDRMRSGSTSPSSDAGAEACVLMRVNSTESEREEREHTMNKLAALPSFEKGTPPAADADSSPKAELSVKA